MHTWEVCGKIRKKEWYIEGPNVCLAGELMSSGGSEQSLGESSATEPAHGILSHSLSLSPRVCRSGAVSALISTAMHECAKIK